MNTILNTHVPELPDEASIKPVLAELPVPYRPLARAGVVNRSGRVYTKECLERAAAKMQSSVNKGMMLVHEPHLLEGKSEIPNLSSVVGIVKEAHFDGEQINIEVCFIKSQWKMIAEVVPISYEPEANCAGSGDEVYEMHIFSILARPVAANR